MPRLSKGLGLSLLVLLIAIGWGPDPIHAENYAFLVAVQDYDVKDLKKLNFTRGDIDEFARTLQKSGFKAENIVVMNDKPEKARFMAESGKIRTQLDLLLGAIESKDTLIVAFSGHGVQFEGDNKNYYCPLDADLDDPKRTSLIALSEIYEKLKECPAEKKLLLVDACRNDPLSAVKKSRATVTLKSVTRPQTEAVPKGVVALFSCSAGQESYEWPDLKHGVFFHHVLEGWNGAAADESRQVTLDGLVAYSKLKTQSFARLNLNALQSPQLKSDFEGTWVLRKLGSSDSPNVVAPTATTGSGTQPSKFTAGSGTPGNSPAVRPVSPKVSPGKETAGKANFGTSGSRYGGPKEFRNTLGMQLLLIPAGQFQMGSPESDVMRAADEVSRAITITKPFYLGKYEVTQKEWKAVMKTEPWKGKELAMSGDEYPAVWMTWEEAKEFCLKLSQSEKRTYRLPTEAEWEYACRGGPGGTGRYHFGDKESDLDEYAWYAHGQGGGQGGKKKGTGKRAVDPEKLAHPVGQKKNNPFGLYDMHGNVSEWCSDWYLEKYLPLKTDPQGPLAGTYRVVRGGCFIAKPQLVRSAHRASRLPSFKANFLGFRVVCTP